MSRRLALLISNDQYADVNLTHLAAPVADAEALATVLRDPTIGAFDEVNSAYSDLISTTGSAPLTIRRLHE